MAYSIGMVAIGYVIGQNTMSTTRMAWLLSWDAWSMFGSVLSQTVTDFPNDFNGLNFASGAAGALPLMLGAQAVARRRR